MTPYEIVIIKDELNIIYHGFLTRSSPEKIYLVCGFGTNWENTQKIEMHKIEESFIAKVRIIHSNVFNFCFCNEKDEWDNNESKDYSYIIENNILHDLETNNNIEKLNQIGTKEEPTIHQDLYEVFCEETEDEYYNYDRIYSR